MICEVFTSDALEALFVKLVGKYLGLCRAVLTGSGVPVSVLVTYPNALVKGVRTSYVCAGVTDTVLICIGVRSNVLIAYVTSAGYLVPVRGSIAVPHIHIVGVAAYYVGTYVTDTVLVIIGVSALNVCSALVTLKISRREVNVIYTLKVLITSVTLKVFVAIGVLCAGKNVFTVVTYVILV